MATESEKHWIDVVRVAPDYRTMQEFVGDGVTDTFEINFAGGYLNSEHIKGESLDEVNGVRTVLDLVQIGVNTFKVSPVPGEGHIVTIYRDTPKETPLLSFQDGAMITAKNLDRNARQAIFAVAEMVDRFSIAYKQVELAEMYAEAARKSATEAEANALFIEMIYERFKLTDELIKHIEQKRDEAVVASEEAHADAQSAKSSADAAENASKTALAAGRLYRNVTEMKAAIDAGKIPDTEIGYVMDGANTAFAYPYQNVGGNPVAFLDSSGVHRAVVSAQYTQDNRKFIRKVENHTSGTYSYPDGEGKAWVDDEGRNLMQIDGEGNKRLYGNTFAHILDVIVRMGLAGSELTGSADSDFIWAITDEDGKVILGIRRIDLKLLYMGKELDGGDTPGPDPETVKDLGLSKSRSMNTVFFLGDSITDNGRSSHNTLNARSWPAWADLVSNGIVQYDGQGATGGFTMKQIETTWLPSALQRKSKFCVLMAGRNDVFQQKDLDAETIPAFKRIMEALMDAGITPVVCTMAAQGQQNSPIPDQQNIRRWRLNATYTSYARKHNLPLVDFTRVTTDPLTGGWWPGWSADVSHPVAIGCRAMGDELARVLKEWLQPTAPRAAECITTPAFSDNKVVNPMFVGNTGWAGATGTNTREGFKGYALVVPPGGFVQQDIEVIKGRQYGVSFRVECPVAGEFSCYVNWTGTETNLGGLRNFNAPIEKPMTFYREGEALESSASILIRNGGTDNLYIGQFGLFLLEDTED